jgi:transcriptional accessory protein Tex/SPT6
MEEWAPWAASGSLGSSALWPASGMVPAAEKDRRKNRLAGNTDERGNSLHGIFCQTPRATISPRCLTNRSAALPTAAFEGRVVKGTITAIENDKAVIDVGLKSEGRVALKEFAQPGQPHGLKVGDEVEVYVDRVENADGEAMLSRDRARREAAWDKLETNSAKASASKASSSAASRAASPSTSTAPWPSCPVRRSTSARSATCSR